MEEVISKLSEIEHTAKHIMDEAEQQKQALTDAMKSQMESYDQDALKTASEKIAQIRSSLETEQNKQLDELQSHTDEVFTSLDTYYEENHARLAKEVYERIISN